MYFIKTPWWLSKLYPQLVWQKKDEKCNVFLTFDDGPIPVVTEYVLDVLKSYQAKATFFCVGENIQKNPQICARILKEGHAIGNHTWQHLNGWQINDQLYLEDIAKCEELLDQYLGANRNRLFRPPYGKIKISQIKKLADYQIIMWDVLSGDFDEKIDPEKFLQKIYRNIEPGSIIVFHDSLKARENLEYMLPKVMDSVQQKNFGFNTL